MMLQEKANQDAVVIDRAIRGRDEARWEAKARPTDLGVEVAWRLDAEEVSASLRADLVEARGLLQVESDEYDCLSSTVLAVCDNLQVVQEEGTSCLAACVASSLLGWASLRRVIFTPGSPKPSPLPILITRRRSTWR